MKKLVFSALLLVATPAIAQKPLWGSSGEQWLDSVCQTIRLTPPPFAVKAPQVSADPVPSVMISQRKVSRETDLSPFRCGPFWVPDPPPLFDDGYRYDCSDYTLGQALFSGFLEGIADAFFFRPQKPGKKKVKQINY